MIRKSTIALSLVLALSACSSTSTAPATVPPAPTTGPMTPAQKFTSACDEYWAGENALGPLIDGLASSNPTAAKVDQAAKIGLGQICVKAPDGTYVNAATPSLASLLPQALGAAGQLTTLFLPPTK